MVILKDMYTRFWLINQLSRYNANLITTHFCRNAVVYMVMIDLCIVWPVVLGSFADAVWVYFISYFDCELR